MSNNSMFRSSTVWALCTLIRLFPCVRPEVSPPLALVGVNAWAVEAAVAHPPLLVTHHRPLCHHQTLKHKGNSYYWATTCTRCCFHCRYRNCSIITYLQAVAKDHQVHWASDFRWGDFNFLAVWLASPPQKTFASVWIPCTVNLIWLFTTSHVCYLISVDFQWSV